MGKILAHEFVSLDGVMETPTWTFDYPFDPKMGQAIAGIMGQAILLGRNTYEMFAPVWSTRTAEDDPGAPFMNDTTKYVVSSTLDPLTWGHSELVGPYDAKRIKDLKDSVSGDLYVSGSGTLVRALLADGLVDELHLFVYPITRGAGPRLFSEDTGATTWSLAGSATYDNGVVYLHYSR